MMSHLSPGLVALTAFALVFAALGLLAVLLFALRALAVRAARRKAAADAAPAADGLDPEPSRSWPPRAYDGARRAGPHPPRPRPRRTGRPGLGTRGTHGHHGLTPGWSQMKKLRLTMNGKIYEVTVEVLEDDEQYVTGGNLPSAPDGGGRRRA